MAKQIALGVLLLVLGFSLFVVGGGTAIRYIDGADSLDINGRAELHGGDVGLPDPGWSFYGGDMGGNRFSHASEITPRNVTELERAWEFRTGDL